MRLHTALVVTLCLLAIPVALAAAAILLAVEDRPRVSREVTVTHENVERAKKIIDAHRDRVRPGMLAAVRVLPEDADNAANYLAHRFGRGSARVALDNGSARVALSLPLTAGVFHRYLNLEATLVETTRLPQFRAVRVGRLALPDRITDLLMPYALRWLQRSPEYGAALDALQKVRFSPSELSVVYLWKGGFTHEVRAAVIGEAERDRLRHYQSLLAQVTRDTPAAVPLAEVLQPLSRAAAERSADGDAVAENRAAILVAMFYVLGKPLKLLLPEAAVWPRAVYREVKLDGRADFAKHFIVSATIAAYADTALSDAVGLYKEIEDSRTGSGFSFNDIAADRAGTRFGEMAVAGAESARRLQQQVASGLTDSDLMPAWADLPESMSEAEFVRRFGGVDAAPYKRMMEEIERRVGELPFLRRPGSRLTSLDPTTATHSNGFNP